MALVSKRTGERKRRSIVKEISRRALGTTDTVIVSWVVTGNLNFTVTIGGAAVYKNGIVFFSRENMEQNQFWTL